MFVGVSATFSEGQSPLLLPILLIADNSMSLDFSICLGLLGRALLGCFNSVTADISTVVTTVQECTVCEAIVSTLSGRTMTGSLGFGSGEELGRYRFGTSSKLLSYSDVLEVLRSRGSILVLLYQENERKIT